MRVRSIFVFLAGVAVGGGAAALGLKKYYRDSYDKIYRQTIVDLENQLKKVQEEKETKEEISKEEPKKEEKTEDGPIIAHVDYHKTSNDYINKNHTKDVQLDRVIDPAEMESPSEEDHQTNWWDRYPNAYADPSGAFEVEEDLFDAITPYGHKELEFYTEDGVMLDIDEEEVVEEYERLVGNVMEDSGFTTDNRDFIYISNPTISAIYCIHKVKGRFYDTNEL